MDCNCKQYTIKVVEGNDFMLLLPLKKRTYESSKPIDEDIDATELQNVVLTIGGVEYVTELSVDGVRVLVRGLQKGTYDVILTATYHGSSIRGAYYEALGVVGWEYQSNAEKYIEGSPFVLNAPYVIAMEGNQLAGYVTKDDESFPTTRQDGSALRPGDYVDVRPDTPDTDFPFEIDGVTFHNRKDEAIYIGDGVWVIKQGSINATNEVLVSNSQSESLSGRASYQSEANAEFATIIGKLEEISVADKTTLISALNYVWSECNKAGYTFVVNNTDTRGLRSIGFVVFDNYGNKLLEKTLGDFVLKTRTIAGADLADDITAEEIQNAIKDLTATLKNKTINADENEISGLETDNFKSEAIATSANDVHDLAHSSDEKLTTEKFVQKTLQNVATPESNTSAVNKGYVDALVEGLSGKVMKFKGYVSSVAPSGTIQNGELWYQGTSLPTVFPFAVKTYVNGAWSSATTQYTPTTLDLWSNLNNGKGYYWFGNNWNLLDENVLVDNVMIAKNQSGELTFKTKSATDKDKVWKVASNGAWSLAHINEWVLVDTFAGLTPNDYTLYVLTQDVVIEDVEYKKGFYSWDQEDGFVLRSSGSGGGGTKDYNELTNQPQVNGNVLEGNKSSAQLGITDKIELYINPTNNEMTVRLKSGNTTVSEQTDTIPTASVVQNAYFDYTTQELVIIFTNGSELRLPFGELVGDMLPMAFNIQLASAGWQQITGTDNYELDLTQAINYILSLIPVYNVVTPEGTENPSEEGWYEKNGQGQYVLTEDTSVVEGKTYYELLHKTLTYNTKFDIALNNTNQSILDASECEQIHFETYLDNGTPKLRAIATDNSPANDLVVQFTMTQIVPNLQGQPLLSNAIYKSGKNYVEKNLFLNKLYPTGSILMTYNKVSPATYIGGTWELIDEGYYPVATVKDAIDEQTERFKEAGLPNITGAVNNLYVKGDRNTVTKTGALKDSTTANNNYGGTREQAGTVLTGINFKASYSNSIYGKSNTVQPKSVLVYVWVRTDDDILTYNFTNISFKASDFHVSETGQVSSALYPEPGEIIQTIRSAYDPNTKYVGTVWRKFIDGIYFSSGSVAEHRGEQLPDITGSMPMYIKTGTPASSTSALYQGEASENNPVAGSSAGFNNLFFKASRNNSIYTNNGKVRPNTFTTYSWIRVDGLSQEEMQALTPYLQE